MKRVARTNEDETIAAIPDIVGVAIGVVQPQLVLVVFDVEDVQIAVGVADYVERAAYITTSRILSRLYRIRHLKCLSTSHQVSSFFKSYHRTTLPETVIAGTLDIGDTGFGSRKP